MERTSYINPLQRTNMGILHAFSNCVSETINHGLSPSEVDCGDPKVEPAKMLKHTSSVNMLIEVDWGDNLKTNYTSSGSMLMEVDWGGKLIINCMVDGELMKLTQIDTTSLKLTGEAMVPVPTI